MDASCLKAGGTHGIAEKPSFSAPKPQRNFPWGFTFRGHPLKYLWPSRHEPAMAVDHAISAKEKQEIKECEDEKTNGNWVCKFLHVKSLWKDEKGNGELAGEMREKSEQDHEKRGEMSVKRTKSMTCAIDDDDGDKKIEFDRESFSKLLRKVPLREARLYTQISYLGTLAYSIPQIKPGNLLRYHGLRFVTSSLEKKEHALKVEKENKSAEDLKKEVDASAKSQDAKENEKEREEEGEEKHIRIRTTAYKIAASATSYLHTKSFLRLNSSKSMSNENLLDEISGGPDNVNIINQDMASLMATTESMTAVVAAKEEVKQAVADDLNSTRSSPCEWFICDDDQSATRFFVIHGSESMASWQANLLFEPIQFEGLDVLVHRGIYEAAKGMYEQMFPEIHAHIKSHGAHAKLRFTGHSLGGSLSVLLNLMLLMRGEAPRSSLLPVIPFGAPSTMCGGDRLLHKLGLPRNHVRSITMHRDIVPRAFSCNYPNHVAEFLKVVNGNFRNHPCLNKQKLLFAPMGEFLILQPENTFSPNHDLLPSGSGLYILIYPTSNIAKAEKQIRAARTVFLNSPHPLEILRDRAAYGSEGTIQRDHDMASYSKSVRSSIHQELKRIRKARRENSRNVWRPLLTPRGINGIVVSKPVNMMGRSQSNFAGFVQTGRESLKRFSTLVASQHMHLLVVLLFPARLLELGSCSLISIC